MAVGAARTGVNRDAAVKAVLDVMLLYEDFGTALRAKQFLDMLRQSVNGTGLALKLWRLDLLAEPLLAEQALIEAVAADVIVLSLHGRRELRAEARNWLDQWLDRKEDRTYALAALLDPEPSLTPQDRPATAYLKRIAKAAGAELLCAG